MTGTSRGFTIVELMVAMVIFLLVAGASARIFISVVSQQRRILSEQQVLNQVSYVEEYVSKALRMAKKDEDGLCIDQGYIYQLTRLDLESGFYRGIKFINQTAGDVCQEFFLDHAVPEDEGTPLILKELKNSSNIADALPLTPENMEIVLVKFGINGGSGCFGAGCPDGASENDAFQPRVTMLFSVKNASDSEGNILTLQTTVSQRNLNTRSPE